MKKSLMKDVILSASHIYIYAICSLLIILITFCGTLLVLSIPQEKIGLNEKIINIPTNLYVVNNEASLKDIDEALRGANRIWNHYNISLKVKEIHFLESPIVNSDRKMMYEEENCSALTTLTNHILGDTPNNSLNIIFVNSSNSTVQGKGCVCDCNYILLDPKKGDVGWNLAHEMGHMLSANVSFWQWNLMIECSSECSKPYALQGIEHDLIKSLKPYFLSKTQISSVLNAIK